MQIRTTFVIFMLLTFRLKLDTLNEMIIFIGKT